MLEGKDDIQSSIEIILSTGLGERVMRPEFGASLERMIFDPLDATQQALMRNAVSQSILLFEPRVILNTVTLEPVPEEGLVRILLDYTISGTNTRDNFVFPFYIEEGTDIPSSNLPNSI